MIMPVMEQERWLTSYAYGHETGEILCCLQPGWVYCANRWWRRLAGVLWSEVITCDRVCAKAALLHHHCEFFELFLYALQGAAAGFETGGCLARCVVGDAVAAAGEEAADQVGGLPGVEARLQEIFAQAGKIGFSKFFNPVFFFFCHCLSRPDLQPSFCCIRRVCWA